MYSIKISKKKQKKTTADVRIGY